MVFSAGAQVAGVDQEETGAVAESRRGVDLAAVAVGHGPGVTARVAGDMHAVALLDDLGDLAIAGADRKLEGGIAGGGGDGDGDGVHIKLLGKNGWRSYL